MTHLAVKSWTSGIPWANSRAMKLSTVPPTSGTLNSTVPFSVSSEPFDVGATDAAAEPEPGAPDTATVISPRS